MSTSGKSNIERRCKCFFKIFINKTKVWRWIWYYHFKHFSSTTDCDFHFVHYFFSTHPKCELKFNLGHKNGKSNAICREQFNFQPTLFSHSFGWVKNTSVQIQLTSTCISIYYYLVWIVRYSLILLALLWSFIRRIPFVI